MEKTIGAISLIALGIFVIANPQFTARGGTTDFSYMNFNILFGLILTALGILLLISRGKNKDENRWL
ncbi:hypothetical protein [Sulfurimonas diazotrophicus]|uniref:LPXTG cell wall anchor domain-containing protein n=1 Tax=Sulfurimonas diazotrophicus TaxID=3131939 RepID=A0ABZ3H8Y5_9BACT